MYESLIFFVQTIDGRRYMFINTYQFTGAILCCVLNNDHETEPITQFLAQYQSAFNEDFLSEFPHATDEFLRVATSATQKEYIASGLGTFGSIMAQFPLGEPAINVEIAIIAQQCSLSVRPRATMTKKWATSTTNLAVAYLLRVRGDKSQNIEEAIKGFEQSLEIFTNSTDPDIWVRNKSNLAAAYYQRIHEDRGQNIEKAITYCYEALEILNPSIQIRLWTQSAINLALCYMDRIRGVHSENIEKAIFLNRQILQMINSQSAPVEWATALNNLGKAYTQKTRGDRTQNLEEAISLYKQALQVRTRQTMPFYWVCTTMNLATTYRYRTKGGRSQNTKSAIALYTEVLQVATKEAMPLEWAMAKNNLAVVYLEADNEEGFDQNVELSLSLCRQALEIRRRNSMPILWAESMNNLGTALFASSKGVEEKSLCQALVACKNSLEVRNRESLPFDWAVTMINIGSIYSSLAREDGNELIQNSINCYKQALEILKPEYFPNECRKAARLLGDIYSRTQKWALAASAYEKSLESAEMLYQDSLFQSSQQAELLETGDLYRNAAYAYAKSGNVGAAVVIMERGRARELSTTLERDRMDLSILRTTSSEIFQTYQKALEELRAVELYERHITSPIAVTKLLMPEEDLRKKTRIIRQNFDAAVKAVRAVPGFQDFLGSVNIAHISSSVRSDNPLVYLFSTHHGGLALIVQEDPLFQSEHNLRITPVWLDGLTKQALLDMLSGENEKMEGWIGAYGNRSTDRCLWLDTIDEVTRKLWDTGFGHVVKVLKNLGHHSTVLIPSHFFGLLPLHAAWEEDPNRSSGRCYAIDLLNISYAPNARAIKAERASKHSESKSLLLVNEPYQEVPNPLPNSELEIKAAANCFTNHLILQKKQASRSEVLKILPHYDVLHFACHGYANFTHPLDSGLQMANDENLSLRDLLKLQLDNVRLAILSACESGLPGTVLPDEVASLPTGLLQAGVAGVISSFWSVSDISTMILLSRFYTLWLNHSVEPVEALIIAQQWLRDATPLEVFEHCTTFMPELLSPSGRLSRLGRQLQMDYSHPYYWAAFSYTGT